MQFAFSKPRTEISRAYPHMCLQTPIMFDYYSYFYTIYAFYIGHLFYAYFIIVFGNIAKSKSLTSDLYLWKKGYFLKNLSNLFRLTYLSRRIFFGFFPVSSFTLFAIAYERIPFPAPNST